MHHRRVMRCAVALGLLSTLTACGQDTPRRVEQAATEEKSLGSRVQAVGERAQQSVQEGESRVREAVESAE